MTRVLIIRSALVLLLAAAMFGFIGVEGVTAISGGTPVFFKEFQDDQGVLLPVGIGLPFVMGAFLVVVAVLGLHDPFTRHNDNIHG